MNLVKNNYQQVVVVATLIERRNSTFLAVKDPLQSLTCSVDVGYVVSISCNVLQVLNLITVLRSVLEQVLRLLVGAYEA